MSQPFLIPLQQGTPQQFGITLNGVQYQLTIRWCSPGQVWIMDIADTNDNPVLQGVPLVTGSDLLEQFEYLGIGGVLLAQTTNNALAVPTFANLGDTGNLYFVL